MEVPRILYIDGTRLRRAVIAGSRHLIARRRHLDHINVFPVPDSDTGTNMAAAARHLIDSLKSTNLASVRQAADAVADAALMGGRGNSGAILAQFFQGLAEGFEERSRARVKDFALAATRAAASAREAVSEPREGTILTVMTDWAGAVTSAARDGADLMQSLRFGHKEAERSLAHTPDLLPVLREAHVVDAGAQGFLYLLDGVRDLIETGFSRTDESIVIDSEDEDEEVHGDDLLEDITFRWCTECMLEGDQLDRPAIRSVLESRGDSVVVAGSSKRLRIHVHTDNPASVLDELKEWGEVTRDKADDMRQQWRHAHHPGRRKVAIVADSATDLPSEILERENIHEVPFRVFLGDEQYIDKVTLTNANFYAKLAESDHHPKTTQPTPADFQRAYELVSKHYDAVLSIHVPANLSGTFQAASKMAQRVSDKITVMDSNSGTVGMGLIVLAAARAADEGLSVAGVEERVRSAMARTSTLISLDTTDYLVKGGRISRARALVGRLLNVRIIFGVNEKGEIVVASKIVGGRNPKAEMLRLIAAAVGSEKVLAFGVSHAAAPDLAERYVTSLKATYGDVEVLVGEFSPALGVHTGPGAIGVAVMTEE